MAFRVFSGWDRRQTEAAAVFAYSVAQNSSARVPIHFISADETPETVPATLRRGQTAFTYARFMVPFACGYEGRALFADGCDCLCLGDVAELADFDMRGKPICVVKHKADPRLMRQGRARSWSSVMLMDCAKLQILSPACVDTVNDNTLMRLLFLDDDQLGDLPPEWNALVDPGSDPQEGAKLAHWSAISDPDVGPWIDASGSALWASWRERWRLGAAA